MLTCSNCRRELSETAQYCPYCGADAPSAEAGIQPTVTKDRGPVDTSPHNLRRWWLSAYLVIGGLGDLYFAYKCLFDEAALRRVLARYAPLETYPSWYFAAAGFLGLAHLLCFIAIWDFLKWGVYGLALLTLLGLALSIYYRAPVGAMLLSLPGWGILLWLLWPVWKYFRWKPD